MHEATTRNTDDAPRARLSPRATLAHAFAVVAGYTVFAVLFFSPVLFSDQLLAPGDGMIYFLPNFYAQNWPWDSLVWGGFPAVGDSQLMTWYPPARLFALAGSWHAFLVSAYVLAPSFAYGYAHSLTRSKLAAAVAGLIYGAGGFLVAHAGHAALVHAAAWTPAVVWSLEMLSRKSGGRARGFWFAAGALSVGCAALAGHPQIFVYTLALGGVYALARGWRLGAARARLGYYSLAALVVLLGTGLAAVQLVPTAELAGLSLRASLGFQDFVSYSLPVRQLPMLLFPYLFGGAPGTVYGRDYFGAWGSEDGGWGAGELSGYVGLLPLLLAAIGFLKFKSRGLAWLWLSVGAVALLLALGDKTPLAQIFYRLPAFNKFRVPARHFMELTLAVAALAAFGVKAVEDGAAGGKFVRRVVAAAACAVLACLAAVLAFAGEINVWAAGRLRDANGATEAVSFAPWSNPATGVPVLVLVAACAALVYWRAHPASTLRRTLLVAVVALDLASFTWFYEWHYAAPPRAYLNAPAAAESLRSELAGTSQRLLPARGGTGRVAELPPNLSKLWGLPSASGYGPFVLARVSRLLSMPPHGSTDVWRDPANRGPDLMAARYLLLPRATGRSGRTDSILGLRWAAQDFAATVGRGCDASTPESFSIELPRPVAADSVALVSALACSITVADDTEVARLTLTDVDGQTQSLSIAAGRDTAEWAHDCADVRPHVRHRRAAIFGSSRAVEREGGVRCESHDYLARFPVPAGLKAIKRIELSLADAPAALALKKLTLADSRSETSVPVLPDDAATLDPARWRRVAEIDAGLAGYGSRARAEDVGASLVYENLRALPRAWLVGEVLSVSEEEALAAARTSRLADGREFDPLRHALVEESFTVADGERGAAAIRATEAVGGTAEIVELTGGTMEVVTQADAPSFLVTSDVYYPGWRATVDGGAARVYQTDYVLRGVRVPAGRHRVRFEFAPRSLRYGAGLSLASLLLTAACALYLGRRTRAGREVSREIEQTK